MAQALTCPPPEGGTRSPRSSGIHVRKHETHVGARLVALAMLGAVAALLAYVGFSVYEYARDAFVAPAILSRDSEVVVASRLRLGEMEADRERAMTDIEGLDVDVAAADEAINRLRELEKAASTSLDWTSTVTSAKAGSIIAELHALSDQKQIIARMIDEQKKLTAEAKDNLGTGLISTGDYARQRQTLQQAEVAMLDNDRESLRMQSDLDQASLAQRALARSGGTPAMPELVARQEQTIRLELEIVRLDSEKRVKLAQKRSLTERVAKIDEMTSQLKARPAYRAIEGDVEVAFVPYTQMDGVAPGAPVYDCLWGLFLCKPVGTVTDLVPGEVNLADPWGVPARGQYAVLDLRDHESARSKTLRVRAWASRAPRGDARLSHR